MPHNRDLVPENIIISPGGAQVIDFGEGTLDDAEGFALDVRSLLSLFFEIAIPFQKRTACAWGVMRHALELYAYGELQKAHVWDNFQTFLSDSGHAADPVVLLVFESLLEAKTCHDVLVSLRTGGKDISFPENMEQPSTYRAPFINASLNQRPQLVEACPSLSNEAL